MTPTKMAVVAVATAVATLLAGPAHAGTTETDAPPVVLAQDPTPAPEPLAATLIGIDANVVNALTVTGHGGKPVTATARGQRTRTVTSPANRPAVLRNLAPGVRYTVAIAGRRIGTAIPVARVGAASGLTVETTDTPGTVLLTWSHAATTGEGANVAYAVTATPLNADGTDGPTTNTSVVTGTSTTVNALATTTRYRFAVTPSNSASTGRPTTAVMSRPLSDFVRPAGPPATPAPTAPAIPSPAPAPASAPAPPPAPAPAPATKTIYVCPDGYIETSTGACQKMMAYIFHRVTQTTPYTYHQESQASTVSVPATFNGSVWTWSCPSGYDAGGGQWGVGICKGTVQATVKDYPPTGWYDTGTCYAHDMDVKDALPTGYTDDGTQWVTVTSKIAKTVPA